MAKKKLSSLSSLLANPKNILVIILLVAAGAFYVGSNKEKLNVNNNESSVVSDETANWQRYTHGQLGINFKFPSSWYIENEQGEYLRIQNYNPTGAPGRDYDATKDKGMFAVQFRKIDKVINTQDELISYIEENNSNNEKVTGDKTYTKSQQLITINGYKALQQKTSRISPTNPTAESIYILDGRGKVIEIIPALDTTSEEITFDQIISTFKFTQ